MGMGMGMGVSTGESEEFVLIDFWVCLLVASTWGSGVGLIIM
jgi:hypothetical protein